MTTQIEQHAGKWCLVVRQIVGGYDRCTTYYYAQRSSAARAARKLTV